MVVSILLFRSVTAFLSQCGTVGITFFNIYFNMSERGRGGQNQPFPLPSWQHLFVSLLVSRTPLSDHHPDPKVSHPRTSHIIRSGRMGSPSTFTKRSSVTNPLMDGRRVHL